MILVKIVLFQRPFIVRLLPIRLIRPLPRKRGVRRRPVFTKFRRFRVFIMLSLTLRSPSSSLVFSRAFEAWDVGLLELCPWFWLALLNEFSF